PAGGTVTFAGTVPASGKSVTIATGEGYAVTLTHLGSIAAAEGAVVSEGDLVGTVGPSGEAEVAQPYVHLGVRVAADPQGYVDPLSLLPPQPAAPEPASPPADQPDPATEATATAPAAAPPAAVPALTAVEEARSDTVV